MDTSDRTTKKLLTETELALELSAARCTLRQWRAKGIGPAWIRCGKMVRYAREDVDTWLAAQRTSAGSAS